MNYMRLKTNSILTQNKKKLKNPIKIAFEQFCINKTYNLL